MHTPSHNDQSDPAVTGDLLLHAARAYHTAWLRVEVEALSPRLTRVHWLAEQNLMFAGHTLAAAALRYADAVAAQPCGEERS